MSGCSAIKLASRGPSHLAAKLGAQCTVRVEARAVGVTSAHAVSIVSNACANLADRRASAAVGMVVCGRLSDTARERRWRIVIPGGLGVAGLLVGSLLVLTMPKRLVNR